MFSAILTAFLIESKNLLQQDSADVSAALLLMIAQSQQRVEQGEASKSLQPIEIPSFSVPITARWINGLWFASLALSLSAALVAMLAKEWLTAFTSARPRPAHTYSILRQTRLEGLVQWRALHIIDLLPSMLHLALLLFSFGLTIYLWTLDQDVAYVIVIITGATFLFYVATSIFGAIHEFCPFVTQISKYIRNLLLALGWKLSQISLGTTNMQTKTSTTARELRALKWLADNARDPAAGDCAYQVLAGLRMSASETSKNPKEYSLLGTLFDSVCTRLSEAPLFQPRELANCLGINVARYAAALPRIIGIIERQPGSHPKRHGRNVKKGLPHVRLPARSCPNTLRVLTLQTLERPAQSALKALDSIWSNDCPHFSPDSYAILTSAELRLTVCVADLHHSAPSRALSRVSEQSASKSSLSTNPARSSSHTPQVADVRLAVMENDAPKAKIPLFDLRARYSRALCRAAFQLIFHTQGSAPINPGPLIYLLNSITLAGHCGNLVSESQTFLSTHHPQSESGSRPKFGVHILGTGAGKYLEPLDIGDEDGLIIGILKVIASANIEANPGIEVAAGNALAAIVPTVLRQWLRIVHLDSDNDFSFAREILNDWPLSPGADKSNEMVDWTIKQLLVITTVALSLAGRQGIRDLPEQAMFALYSRAKLPSGHRPTYRTLTDSYEFLEALIYFVELKNTQLSAKTIEYFVGFIAIKHPQYTSLAAPSIDSTDIPGFLRILTRTPGCVSEIQSLLPDLCHLVTGEDDYLQIFTRSSDGFPELVKIAAHVGCSSDTVACIARIVIAAAGQELDQASNSDKLLEPAVPGFLDAVALTLKHMTSSSEPPANSTTFMSATLWLLCHLRDDCVSAVAKHTTTETICSTLRGSNRISEIQARLLEELVEIQEFSRLEDLPLRAMRQPFEGEQDVSFHGGV